METRNKAENGTKENNMSCDWLCVGGFVSQPMDQSRTQTHMDSVRSQIRKGEWIQAAAKV